MVCIAFGTLLTLGTLYDACVTVEKKKKKDSYLKDIQNGIVTTGNGVVNGGFTPNHAISDHKMQNGKAIIGNGDVKLEIQNTPVDTMPERKDEKPASAGNTQHDSGNFYQCYLFMYFSLFPDILH